MFSAMPPWLLSLSLLVVMVIGREAGHFIHQRRRPTGTDVGEAKDEFTLSAVLGLLALLIGFTFSLALTRYETRRALVVTEANAMGTTWLRFDLLEPEQRSRARDLMRQYAAARLAYGLAEDVPGIAQASQRADEIQARLWNELASDVKPDRTTPFAQFLLGPANEMIDTAGERTAAAAAHVPTRLFGTLALYCIVAAGLTGYLRGLYRTATTLVFVLVVLALGLVADLDSPKHGLVRVPQEPMATFLRSTD